MPTHFVRPACNLRLAVISAIASIALSCAPRAMPIEFPRASAASPGADAAPVATVGIALANDPPLPGEATTGWNGLANDTPPSVLPPPGDEAPDAH